LERLEEQEIETDQRSKFYTQNGKNKKNGKLCIVNLVRIVRL